MNLWLVFSQAPILMEIYAFERKLFIIQISMITTSIHSDLRALGRPFSKFTSTQTRAQISRFPFYSTQSMNQPSLSPTILKEISFHNINERWGNLIHRGVIVITSSELESRDQGTKNIALEPIK